MLKLPQKQSFFLFGPRQTGKSTLVETSFSTSTWKVDLLLSDVFLTYAKDPSRFRKEALEQINRYQVSTIFVDEIQKIPALLDEVHFLIGATKAQFILTGSSARKLKRGGANLLAGRAFERFLFPLVYLEIKNNFDLDSTLLYGSLPAVYLKDASDKIDMLNAYTNTYLREEIQSEGMVRNIGGFSRFLEVAAAQNGEMVNFSSIARECQLPIKSVQGYYQILEDTLVGLRLAPWGTSVRRRLVAHPKFYFFDLGVTNAINRRLTAALNPVLKGRLFKQWIFLELERLRVYRQSESRLFYWRTNHGGEVDIVIEKHGRIKAAVEIKSTAHVSGADLSGLRSFNQDNPDIPNYVVCTATHPYKIENVSILPWDLFLSDVIDELL